MAPTKNSKKIVIIGAGPAGLISAKYALAEGHKVEIFEQSGKIGGTWNYTDETGIGKDGLPIHSAMYKDLRTNVPKELMECMDYFYPKDMKLSYISPDHVLEFFRNYTKDFKLEQYIKFHTRVINVRPIENGKWEVKTKNLIDGTTAINTYCIVMVCSGHYSYGYIPDFPGREEFKGVQLHSHDYRSPEPFVGKKCLVVGLGLSGQDMVRVLLPGSKKVYVSYKLKKRPYVPDAVIEKPLITKINAHTVEFEDGTTEEIDVIIYCTGYEFRYPFLSKECGITSEDWKWVKPLYKQVVNIEHPTMCFIGLLQILAVMPMFDLQARFYMSILNGHFPLPSKEEMYEDLKRDVERKKQKGMLVPRHMHFIGNADNQEEYFEDVAKTAKIERVPTVINKLFAYVCGERMSTGLKNSYFKILDDNRFEQIML